MLGKGPTAFGCQRERQTIKLFKKNNNKNKNKKIKGHADELQFFS